jgi:hypothetical protein
MKKKEYINPEMQVVKIQHHGQLLADSVVQSILSEDEDFVLDDDGFEDFIEDV